MTTGEFQFDSSNIQFILIILVIGGAGLLFYLEIKVTSMNNDERNTNYGKPNNYKSTLTSLQDGKLLPLIIGINENGLLNIFKTIINLL